MERKVVTGCIYPPIMIFCPLTSISIESVFHQAISDRNVDEMDRSAAILVLQEREIEKKE